MSSFEDGFNKIRPVRLEFGWIAPILTGASPNGDECDAKLVFSAIRSAAAELDFERNRIVHFGKLNDSCS
jgi:hypothetical protein